MKLMDLNVGSGGGSVALANVSAVGCPRTLRVKKSIHLRVLEEYRRRDISNNLSPHFVEHCVCGLCTWSAYPIPCLPAVLSADRKGPTILL